MFESLEDLFASIDSVSVKSRHRFLSKLDPDTGVPCQNAPAVSSSASVPGLPALSRNATRCASRVAPRSLLSGADVLVLSNEDKVLLAPPLLEQVFEGLSHHRFTFHGWRPTRNGSGPDR